MAYTSEEFLELDLDDEKMKEPQSSEDYYEELGRLIEEHPIGLPINPRLL